MSAGVRVCPSGPAWRAETGDATGSITKRYLSESKTYCMFKPGFGALALPREPRVYNEDALSPGPNPVDGIL